MPIEGMDAFRRKLERLAKMAEEVDGTVVPLGEVFPPSYMREHTKFENIDAFFRAGGFAPESQEELSQLDETALDAHVKAHTPWPTWSAMKARAGEVYIARRFKELP